MKKYKNYVDKIVNIYKLCEQVGLFLHITFHKKLKLSTNKNPLSKANLNQIFNNNLGIINRMSFQQTKISLGSLIKAKTKRIHISPLTITITSYLIYKYNY